MRVVITTDAAGGVLSHVRELAAGLSRRRHAVTLAVLGPPPREGALAFAASLGIDVRVAPFALEWTRDHGDDPEASAEWLAWLAGHVDADVVHSNQFVHGAFDLAGRPRLVVAHSDVCSWWHAVHGVEAPRDDPWLARYRALVAAGLSGADAVVAVSRFVARGLIRHHAFRGSVRVIHNGVSPRASSLPAWTMPGGPLFEAPRERAILLAGRLWDEAKGARTLLLAAERLPEGFEVALAGESAHPDGGEGLPPAGRARLLGVLDEVELARAMREAGIYVGASVYEPFGLAPVEAALAGCALVLADTPSFRELWDGAAVFFPPRDPSALADALVALSGDPPRREALADRARRRARIAFDPERMIDAYLDVYATMATDALVTRALPLRPTA